MSSRRSGPLVTKETLRGAMNEFGRTSLLMLAASIGPEDPWVMAASSGAVTLSPLRMMSEDERRSTVGRSVLLRLADLGYITATDEGATSSTSPLSNSIGVLLLPWSLQATLARLDLVARTTTAEIPSHYAPEDWLATGHYFFDDADWSPADPIDEIARLVNSLRGLPAAGKRHFIFGSLAGELAPFTIDDGLVRSPRDDGGRTGPLREQLVTHDVDPLVYTNPGSAPEGVSPLFAHHEHRAS
jgi:hypothetical protein